MAIVVACSAFAAPPAVAAVGAKKLLVVTVTKEFRHESIPTAERVIEQLGSESGTFTVDFARTDEDLAAKMNAKALEGYDGVAFVSTTGDLPLPDREAFLQWIEGGKGFVGVHAASDTFHDWRPFVEMLGGEFDYHRKQARVVPRVEDPAHPATRDLPKGLEVLDEIYLFKSFDRSRVHPLLSLDRHPNHDEAGYYPLAWTRRQDQGRVFYTAFGHREDVLEAAWFKAHLLGGIRWALGAAPTTAP